MAGLIEAVALTAKQSAPHVAITGAAVFAAADGHLGWRAGAVTLGLVAGAMWRAGNLKSEGRDAASIRADLIVSALIGLANAVLALAIVDWMGVGILLAMVVGVLVGATGVRAIPEVRDLLVETLKRKLGDRE